MSWCPNCYKAYDEGEKICKSCGAKLTEEAIINNDSVKAQVLSDDSVTINEEINLDENHSEQAEVNNEENDNNQDELKYKLEDDNLDKLNNEVDATTQNEFDYEEVEQDELNTDELNDDKDELNDVKDELNDDNDELNDDEVNSDYDEATSELDEFDLENPNFLEKDTLSDEEKELISAIRHPVNSNTYIKKEEEYTDLQSAGYTFFIVSIIGLALLAINALGYINIFSGLLSNIVMGALFIAFLIIGISSFKKANKVKGEVAQENQMTESINTWLSENVTLEFLDSSVNADDNEEVQFMQKLDKMKDMVTEAFGELDELYLDRIVEEFYNNNFDEQ